MVYYNLSLEDEEGNAITGFGTCTVTLPLPSDWNVSDGTIEVKTLKESGELETIKATIVEVNGKKCVKFNTSHFSDFGIVYTVKEGSGYTLTITDMRKGQTNTECIQAGVKDMKEDLFLYIRDKDSPGRTTSEILKSLVTLASGEKMEWYDITLKKATGEDATDFTNCTIILPLPAYMDTSKGSVRVMTVSKNNTLEELKATLEEGKNAQGKKVQCIRFTTTHFSEFGIVYKTTSSATSGKTSNAKVPKKYNGNDMPRTGDSDIIRILIAMALFLFGITQIITSVYVKKEKIEDKTID